jgi:hypothetical protein
MLTGYRPKEVFDLVICIPDMHWPYAHPDLLRYLRSVKAKYSKYFKNKKYKVLVLFGGDEVDFAEISFHDSHPELPKADRELEMAVRGLKEVYKIFPKAVVLESNHGSMVQRRRLAHNLPKAVFKTYNEYLEAPKTWKWVRDIAFKVPGTTVYGCHGKTNDVVRLSKSMAMSAVQFHFHEKMGINYWASPAGLFFAVQCGCVVNDDSLAFAYNKGNVHRPLLGVTIIENGVPHIHPLLVDEKNRWIGELK